MSVEHLSEYREIVDIVRESGGEPVKACYQCGLCDTVCPWNRVTTFSMRRIVREATFGLTEIESEDIWRCTTCGRCPQQCPRDVRQIDVSVALRRMATEFKVFPTHVQSIRGVTASLQSEGNPLNEKRADRANWAEGLGVKTFTEGMEILYFPCCYVAYDPRLKKVARSTAELLKRAGVKFGILGSQESCCGESIRKTGNEELFKRLARENIRNFIENGVTKIVVSSPHCYHAFKNEYAEFKVNFEVLSISEYLLALVDEGRLQLGGDGKGGAAAGATAGDATAGVGAAGVGDTGGGAGLAAAGESEVGAPASRTVTYHDPCYMGRHNGLYDQARELIRRMPGVELSEMPESRVDSLCCGGGGGRIWMDTLKGERFSDLRLEQAIGVGADVLVTSCPYCVANFEESRLNSEAGSGIEVKDITEMLREAL